MGNLREKLRAASPAMADATEALVDQMGGRVLYMEIGNKTFGNKPKVEHSVDLLAELEVRDRERAARLQVEEKKASLKGSRKRKR